MKLRSSFQYPPLELFSPLPASLKKELLVVTFLGEVGPCCCCSWLLLPSSRLLLPGLAMPLLPPPEAAGLPRSRLSVSDEMKAET